MFKIIIIYQAQDTTIAPNAAVLWYFPDPREKNNNTIFVLFLFVVALLTTCKLPMEATLFCGCFQRDLDAML